MVLDGLFLWAYFSRTREQFVNDCINGSTDSRIIQTCQNEGNLSKGYVIGGVVMSLLFQACESPSLRLLISPGCSTRVLSLC